MTLAIVKIIATERATQNIEDTIILRIGTFRGEAGRTVCPPRIGAGL